MTEPTRRARIPAAQRPRRASQRVVISINLAQSELKDLMVEQCKDGPCYITAYRGSRVALQAAGVPEAAFAFTGPEFVFQLQTINVCCTGRHELLKGTVRAVEGGFELEVDWGLVRPYTQGAHRAVSELARMLLIDVCWWVNGGVFKESADLTLPMRLLAQDERATDYKPDPAGPRLQVTPEFRQKLRKAAEQLFQLVHSECEVLQTIEPVRDSRPATLRVVSGAN